MKTLAIIDIDGTITDFYKVDSEIISKLYGHNRIIKMIDKLLWKINSLDVITNRFLIFQLRMRLYSLLNSSKYGEDVEMYREEYVEKAKQYFHSFMDNEYLVLKEKGIEILLLTCDPFDGFCEEAVTVVQDKCRYVLDNVPSRYDEVYVIGNNYMDDIRVGLKLRMKMRHNGKTRIFYVGSSSAVIKLVKDKEVLICKNLKQVIKSI